MVRDSDFWELQEKLGISDEQADALETLVNAAIEATDVALENCKDKLFEKNDITSMKEVYNGAKVINLDAKDVETLIKGTRGALLEAIRTHIYDDVLQEQAKEIFSNFEFEHHDIFFSAVLPTALGAICTFPEDREQASKNPMMTDDGFEILPEEEAENDGGINIDIDALMEVLDIDPEDKLHFEGVVSAAISSFTSHTDDSIYIPMDIDKNSASGKVALDTESATRVFNIASAEVTTEIASCPMPEGASRKRANTILFDIVNDGKLPILLGAVMPEALKNECTFSDFQIL